MSKYVVGYWSINGVPSCRAEEARLCGTDLECACTPEKYEKLSQTLLKHFPEAVVKHHIGERCPINDKEWDDYMEYSDALEERTREKFAMDDGERD